MRFDVMVDIETLGTSVDSSIIQISALCFDIKNGEHIDHFERFIDVSNSGKMSCDGNTLKWWLNTDAELFKQLVCKGNVSEEEALRDFHKWLKGFGDNLYLWGNGILFDNRIVKSKLENAGLDYPVGFRNDRDLRTLIEVAGEKEGVSSATIKNLFKPVGHTAHNATDDCVLQANMATWAYRKATE